MGLLALPCLARADWRWTYDGISGPQYWGLINRDWALCERGRAQSPVNIDPTRLSYDSTLGQVGFQHFK